MTIMFYAQSRSKRAVDLALVDSGATETFMNLKYAQYLGLPIQEMKEPQMVFNVDGTPNKSGEIKYYTDLKVQTGPNHTMFRFFLTNTGQSKVILGYPWMAAVQPRIDWKKGWIDHAQLPVVLHTPDAHQARFLPQEVNKLRMRPAHQYFIGHVTIGEMKEGPLDKIPLPYHKFSKVFSEEASHEFPPTRVWDHAIELKPNVPTTLPGKIYPLSQV